MSQASKTRLIVLCGIFTCLGVVFPRFFHFFGAVSGQTFLPMHIPVLLAGLTVSSTCGAITGVLCPLLSCFLTSMPTLIKMPFMCIELFCYGFFAGLFTKFFDKKLKNKVLSVYISLLASQICGRIVNILCTMIIVYIFGMQNPAISVKAALLSVPAGIVGIVIQLVFIPPIVLAIKRVSAKKN